MKREFLRLAIDLAVACAVLGFGLWIAFFGGSEVVAAFSITVGGVWLLHGIGHAITLIKAARLLKLVNRHAQRP